MPPYSLILLGQLHSDELRTRPVSELLVELNERTTQLHLWMCTRVQWLKKKQLDNPGACSSSNFTKHGRHSLSHDNKILNRYKIRQYVKHNEIAENVEKHCTQHSKRSVKDVRSVVITISATRDVLLRHYCHVWRLWLFKQEDYSKQQFSNFPGHSLECWHPFLNFVLIKRKETAVTGCASLLPCVKKRTTTFQPVDDGCRGFENG